jgi:multidrug resistance efflux pump
MNVVIERLHPSLPDPVESRRRAAGRLVRFTYALAVFGVLAFFIVYFGAPLVFLSGPGTVTAARHVVSLPYIVRVLDVSVVAGATVKAGEEIARVRSLQAEELVANYLRALADIAGRKAELRVKARVAQESLATARSYLALTQEGVDQLESMPSAASLNYRIEIRRERAAARKAVVSQEAEIAESITQLANLDEIGQQIRERLNNVELSFAGGHVLAPIAGIVSANLAYAGQSLVAGSTIAVVYDPNDIFVEWYVPNERLVDPEKGQEVNVVFGNRRIPGTIVDILPVSGIYAAAQPVLVRERPSTQLARIRFSPGSQPPALNTTVHVHMYYTDFAASSANWLIGLLGLN